MQTYRRVLLLLLSFLFTVGHADRIVFKNRAPLYGTITKENLEKINYLDRFDRPRIENQKDVDSIWYDEKNVFGDIKIVFRKGQPFDRSGFIKMLYGEKLDLNLEYKTDSLTELDLFFKSNVHMRIQPGSRFKVLRAPSGLGGEIKIQLFNGAILYKSHDKKSLVKIFTLGGNAIGRGECEMAVKTKEVDSTVLGICLKGLAGIQESEKALGELVIEEGGSINLGKRDGVFQPMDVDKEEVHFWVGQINNMGHYQLRKVEYPPVGWLAKAFTGFGFLVFFYGSAVGVLNYVNNI